MELSDATEKIPSDTTGNRSQDIPTSKLTALTTTPPQAAVNIYIYIYIMIVLNDFNVSGNIVYNMCSATNYKICALNMDISIRLEESSNHPSISSRFNPHLRKLAFDNSKCAAIAESLQQLTTDRAVQGSNPCVSKISTPVQNTMELDR
jgi:hypothetical protein